MTTTKLVVAIPKLVVAISKLVVAMMKSEMARTKFVPAWTKFVMARSKIVKTGLLKIHPYGNCVGANNHSPPHFRKRGGVSVIAAETIHV
jgi:hypothetical protein